MPRDPDGTRLGHYEVTAPIGEGLLADDVVLDDLRPDPRFQELRRRIGL